MLIFTVYPGVRRRYENCFLMVSFWVKIPVSAAFWGCSSRDHHSAMYPASLKFFPLSVDSNHAVRMETLLQSISVSFCAQMRDYFLIMMVPLTFHGLNYNLRRYHYLLRHNIRQNFFFVILISLKLTAIFC